MLTQFILTTLWEGTIFILFWGNWGTKMLSNFPKATQLVGAEPV